MAEVALYPWLVGGVLAVAAIVFGVLFRVDAPYGRHARGGWGPTVPGRVGWLCMEAPALFVFLFIYGLGRYRANLVAEVFLGLWFLHYGWRALLDPLVRRTAGRDMPAVVVAMGASFNVLNAYLNARWVSGLHRYPEDWLGRPWVIAGIVIFLVGWGLNQHADHVLRRLRGPGETGYRVPSGGLHRFVASPNYFGELVEWGGWALATWSPAGLAFFVFSFANLAPRAHAHLRWYRATFPEYPRERRALIPGIW